MRKFLVALPAVLVLAGCGTIKAYKADRALAKDVRAFISKSIDGNVDCLSACEALKAYVKARYGQ